jgi:flagellar assembly factor FliW
MMGNLVELSFIVTNPFSQKKYTIKFSTVLSQEPLSIIIVVD